MQNKWMPILLIITLVLVTVTLVFNFIGFGSMRAGVPVAGTAGSADTVAVYGQGKITVDPDVAYITCGFENTDTDPQKAQNDNAAQMDRIIGAVKNAGISDSAIQTAQYSVNQEYGYMNDKKKISGYRVANTVKIKIEAVDKAGGIIKVAYDAGANLFYGISFDIVERQKAYLDALAIAEARAQEKAAKLAADAGKSIGGVVSIQESGTSYYSPLSNYATAQAVPSAIASDSAISSGQLEITAVVNITYALK